jgi:phage replication initiation protein
MSFYVSPYYLEQNENKDLGLGGNAPPASNTGGTPDLAQPKTYTIFNNHGSILRLPSDFEPLFPELEILRRIEAAEKSAFIDTVSITFKSKSYFHAFPDSIAITSDGTDIVNDISVRLYEILGFGVTSKRSNGINNYKDSYNLGNDWGHIAIGGIFQRDSIQIYINGQGCLSAKNGWENRLFEYATKVDGTITRIDVAHDSFDGSYTVDKAVQSHIDGEFKTKNAPKNLRSKQEGCWNYEALGLENTGRTYYIGERKSGKMFRVYEKGYEIAGKLNKYKETAEIFKNEFEQWVRVELELGNQNRVIPLDILLHPEQYLAGSAPALAFISEEQKISKVRKKTVKASLENARVWLKKQCGKWLYAFQEMECTNESGLVDEKKLVQMIKSLMLEEIPRAFKIPDYRHSAPQMDFINFNDKKEYETEKDFIDRTFPIISNAMNSLLGSAKKRGKKYDVINDENWNHFDFVDV